MAKKLEIPLKTLTLWKIMTNHLLMKLQEWNKLMKNQQGRTLMVSLQEWTLMPSPQEWRLKLIMVKYMNQLPKSKKTMDLANKSSHQR